MKRSWGRWRGTLVFELCILAGVFWTCWACGGTSPSSKAIEPTKHTVVLSWTASTTPQVKYNIYRGTEHLGPYPTKLNSNPQTLTTFTDSSVQNGAIYYYVVTAVDTQSVESGYSNEVQAVIPPS